MEKLSDAEKETLDGVTFNVLPSGKVTYWREDGKPLKPESKQAAQKFIAVADEIERGLKKKLPGSPLQARWALLGMARSICGLDADAHDGPAQDLRMTPEELSGLKGIELTIGDDGALMVRRKDDKPLSKENEKSLDMVLRAMAAIKQSVVASGGGSQTPKEESSHLLAMAADVLGFETPDMGLPPLQRARFSVPTDGERSIAVTANLSFYACSACGKGLLLMRIPENMDRYQGIEPYALDPDAPLAKLAETAGLPIVLFIEEPQGARLIQVYPGPGRALEDLTEFYDGHLCKEPVS